MDTEWAVGDISAYNTLSYGPCPLEGPGGNPAQHVGTTYVVHLMSEDIYFSLTLTGWGGQGNVPPISFEYMRTTPGVAPPPPTPTVTLTGPTNLVFAAPASLKLSANASVSSGTVTNVEYFANALSLGSATTSPFKLTSALPLGVGSYSITAVATAAGVSATSAPPFNISVVVPVTNTISSGITNGKFQFAFTTTPGLTYVVETSPNLKIWLPVSTNVPAGNVIHVTNTLSPSGNTFFRVARLPNP